MEAIPLKVPFLPSLGMAWRGMWSLAYVPTATNVPAVTIAPTVTKLPAVTNVPAEDKAPDAA
ncbi:MAG: hypothetical protein Q8Q52_07270 [Acidimicrobiia bacterium]|nr:hypothetical protein [Acidimicrobiia bacterium]